MNPSNDFQLDLAKVKNEPMEMGASIKIDSFTGKSTDLKLNLECINEDMIHYEQRESPGAKLKTEPSEFPDIKTASGKQAKVKSEVEQKNETIYSDTNSQKDMISIQEKSKTETSVNKIMRPVPENGNKNLSIINQESKEDTWTPIGMSKLVEHFEGNDNWKSDLNITRASELSNKKTTGNTDKDRTAVQNNSATRKKPAAENSAKHSSKRKENGKSDPKGSSSQVFKDPNKVLDPNSYIYHKRANGREMNQNGRKINKNGLDMNQNRNNYFSRTVASSQPSINSLSTSTIRESMEKKSISFVNKVTKQRRESYLIYFNDFGLEVILASHKDSDQTEMYARKDNPNTFYRLFYNFVKAEETNPKPAVTTKEIEIIAKEIEETRSRIDECKERERSDDVCFKKPRLTEDDHNAQNSELDIVRSARQLIKMRKGSATGNYSKTSEHNQNTFRPSPNNRYWDFRGRRYMDKDK